MLSRNKVKNRIPRKTNPVLASAIEAALKEKSWMPLAKKLSSSTREFPTVNLSEIDSKVKDNSFVVIPGKVLGTGTLSKKVSLYALSFSQSAVSKLDKAKITYGSLMDAMKQNKKATGVQILS